MRVLSFLFSESFREVFLLLETDSFLHNKLLLFCCWFSFWNEHVSFMIFVVCCWMDVHTKVIFYDDLSKQAVAYRCLDPLDVGHRLVMTPSPLKATIFVCLLKPQKFSQTLEAKPNFGELIYPLIAKRREFRPHRMKSALRSDVFAVEATARTRSLSRRGLLAGRVNASWGSFGGRFGCRKEPSKWCSMPSLTGDVFYLHSRLLERAAKMNEAGALVFFGVSVCSRVFWDL